MDFIMTIAGQVYAVLSAIDWAMVLTITTAAALLVGIAQTAINLHRSQKTEQARLYFEIAERWSETLKKLYLIRNAPPPSLEELETKYNSCAEFMNTETWKEDYRQICNFFEDLGLLAHEKNLPVDIIRVLVTVSDSDYLLMKPVLDYLRRHYRSDIYCFWNYLLEQSKKTKPIRPYKDTTLYEPA